MIKHVLSITATNAMLRSPTGGVMLNMKQRGYRVEAEAKRRVKADTGRLRTSIHARVFQRGTVIGVEVGTDVKYAPYVHGGTGIYGPYHMLIKPTSGGALRFRVKGQAGYVFAKSVQGQVANPFLREALKFARF